MNGTDKEDETIPRLDSLSQFIIDSFDSVHFYLFHLFESGLRTLKADVDSEQKEDDEIEDEDADQNQSVDRAFLRRKKRLKSARNKLADYFQRHEGAENKFVISQLIGDKKETGNKTYFDQILDALSDVVDAEKRMRRYLMEHGFDSDAVRDDVERYPNPRNSNLFGVLDQDSMKKMSYFVNRRRSTFCCSLNSMHFLFLSVSL